jgi:seryl-tRNA synthetase
MFALTKGSERESDSVLTEFVEIQKEICEEMGFSYRVLNMATEELGAAAYRKYDVEVWMPSK